MKMNIKNFYTGSFQTNCFLVWNEKKEAYFFDCESVKLDGVFDFIEKENLDLKYIVLTHGHADHICGLKSLKEKYEDAIIYIGKEDEEFLTNPTLNLSPFIIGKEFLYTDEVKTVKEGDMVGEFLVIDTPGHTIGSKCFYNKENNFLISGDTMFRRSFGRCDFPTGSERDMFSSLKKLCDMLPPETLVFNGHTGTTTIGEEKEFLTRNRLI